MMHRALTCCEVALEILSVRIAPLADAQHDTSHHSQGRSALFRRTTQHLMLRDANVSNSAVSFRVAQTTGNRLHVGLPLRDFNLTLCNLMLEFRSHFEKHVEFLPHSQAGHDLSCGVPPIEPYLQKSGMVGPTSKNTVKCFVSFFIQAARKI